MASHNYTNPFESSAYQDPPDMSQPPPQYTETATSQPPPEKQHPPTNYQQPTFQTSSQPQHQQQQQQQQHKQSPSNQTPRLLHIYREGLTHRHMHIVDSDKQSTIYTITANSGSLFSSKPHIFITAGDTPASSSAPPTTGVVGTITFPKFARHLDLEIDGRALTLDSAGWLSTAHTFRSPASGGEALTWEKESLFGSDLVLHNARGEWIARFDRSVFTMSKIGKLELPGPEVQGPLLDEVVVTGIAVVELARRRRNQSSGASSGAGGC